MTVYNTSDIKSWAGAVRAGDEIRLSGTVYTARDAAHALLFSMLDRGEPLPFDLGGSAIYYAGPTPAPAGSGLAVGSCGPTTSARMDVFTPRLIELGLACTIGKGERSAAVNDSCRLHGALYLCAIGGAGAVASRCIVSAEVIAFAHLGCESVKRMEFREFPLFVATDIHGGDIFNKI